MSSPYVQIVGVGNRGNKLFFDWQRNKVTLWVTIKYYLLCSLTFLRLFFYRFTLGCRRTTQAYFLLDIMTSFCIHSRNITLSIGHSNRWNCQQSQFIIKTTNTAGGSLSHYWKSYTWLREDIIGFLFFSKGFITEFGK